MRSPYLTALSSNGERTKRLSSRITCIFIVILGLALFFESPTAAAAQSRFGPYEYVSPRPNAILVMAESTIAVRHGDEVDRGGFSADLFTVEGSMSEGHTGNAVLADDGKTVIFTPDAPFTPEEIVSVTINAGLQISDSEAITESLSYTFTVSPLPLEEPEELRQVRSAGMLDDVKEDSGSPAELAYTELHTDTHPYATIPATFPFISVTVPADGAGDGYIFTVNLTRGSPDPYLLILENNGEPVFFREMEKGVRFRDLRVQPNGKLTYFYSPDSIFHEMDNTYRIVNSYRAGNGYETDFHGLQVSEGGYALLQVYDDQPIDMSQVVEGGLVTATVTGSIIQELDPSGNVIFEWRSWDHFEILDASDKVDFTSDDVDATHINSAEWDRDGNILVSNRNIDEVTKIDRRTADVIWRFGGKQNQFALTDVDGNEVEFFNWQHDARRQETGTITLFDNGNHKDPPHSRAVEYELDEENLTATQVWEYRNDPDFYGRATGNVQRLPNGNSVIDWGGVGIDSHMPFITEVTPDGTKAYEAYFKINQSSYRTFRFPWEGEPFEPPMLVASALGDEETQLHYSWNGATNVASYEVHGSTTTDPADFVKVDAQDKDSFETTSTLTATAESCYFYRVVPMDVNGEMGTSSNLIFAGDESCSLVVPVTADGAISVTLDTPEVGGSVTLAAPAGVVSETMTLVLDDIITPTQPMLDDTNLVMAFTLDAQHNGVLLPTFNFNAPVSLAVSYSDDAVADLDESTLKVYFWHKYQQQWLSEGIEVTGQDAENNQITFTTDHLSLFALFAEDATPQDTAPTAIVEEIELVADGSFERSVDEPWDYLRPGNDTRSLACTSTGCDYEIVPAHDGERLVYLGGFFREEQVSISQDNITAPAMGSDDKAILSLWVMRQGLSDSIPFTGNNTMQVLIDDTEVISFTDLQLNDKGYTQFSADVTKYLSATHLFRIQGTFEANGGAIYLDNVSLKVSTPEEAALLPTKIYLPFIQSRK